MRRPVLSIGLRLTLWYTLVLAVCLVVFSWVVYSMQRGSLREAAEDNLEERSALLASLITVDSNGQPRLQIDTDDSNLDDAFYRLFDRSGNVVIDNSRDYGDVPLTPQVVAQAIREDDDVWSSVPGKDHGTFLLTEPIEVNDSMVGTLQVGQSREEYVDALGSLLSTLLTTVPIALLITAIIGWWISSRALKPVNQVTQTARDITAGDLSRRLNLELPDDEVGRLARTFDEMIERLDQMVRRQRQFTADASHELRTPLTAIRGQVDVALQQPRDEAAYRTTLGFINEQIGRMTRLVEALLMMARSESGALRLELERVDIQELVESARDIAAPLASEKGLALRLVPGPRAAVRGDESLLLQALLNLVDNAIRYTDRGEVAIGWEIVGRNVELIVQDTGPGVPVAAQARIFEPFYRVDAARSNTRGAGLGLSISKSIVEAHGGVISVESSRQGATFVVALPLTSAEEPLPSRPSEPSFASSARPRA
jgi:heavy metal sensor kinase